MLNWVFCALLLVTLGGASVPAGTPPAYFSSDFKNTAALASWKFKPASVWNCDPRAGVTPGTGALHVKPKGDVVRNSAESTLTLKLDHPTSVLLSGLQLQLLFDELNPRWSARCSGAPPW